jgi:uncharacterized repeat protein (TIGR02543 family)
MLDFFKKIFRKRKPDSKSAQVKRGTRPGWRKRITRVKEKPRIPRIEWWDRFPLRRRILIIAAAVGIGLGAWFGIQSYQPPLPMYSLSIATNPDGGGSVSASCGGVVSPIRANYRDGSPVTLTATPSAGYEFGSWAGDASGTSPMVTITMDGDKDITADFHAIRYTLSTSVSPPEGGMISAGSGTYEPGSSVALTATPSPGYEFISWTGDTSGTSPKVTVTMDSDKSVTANFSIVRYRLEVSVSPPEGGMLNAGSGTYEPGSSVALVATPSPGYEFISWAGDVSGTSPEVSVTIDSDKSVTANFETIAQRIEYTMLAGEISGSVISFSNVLDRGGVIEGFVELTGEYKTRDRTFRWNFEIINPEGRQEDMYRGHWVNKTYHDFSFTVAYNGTYKIKVDHNSLYDLYLVIEVEPKGWESSKP